MRKFRRLGRNLPRPWRNIAALSLILPASCAMPPQNPFLGAWATPEHNQITFRDATLVINPTGQPATELNPQACAGTFRFGYGRKSRDELAGLVQRQPDLRNQLGMMLQQPDYPVAELGCDQGS